MPRAKKETVKEARTGRQDRRKRIPMGGMRLRMNVDRETLRDMEKKGLIPRWINDEDAGARIRDAKDAGYEFVESHGGEEVGDNAVESDRRIKLLVGTHKDGSPKYSYLMAQRKEWYEEDQKEKAKVADRVDDAIRGGQPRGLNSLDISPEKGGTYVKDVRIT